jgi:hypothetical protein
MHAGRNYPFAPIFWATESWFWPGFVPWKMHLLTRATTWFPYSLVPAGSEFVSGPMHCDDPPIEAYYDFDLNPVADVQIYIGLKKSIVLGARKAYWELAFCVSGIQLTFGELYQRYPQRVVYADDILQTDPAGPSGGPAGIIPVTFRPATYAEGGSPWPNY